MLKRKKLKEIKLKKLEKKVKYLRKKELKIFKKTSEENDKLNLKTKN